MNTRSRLVANQINTGKEEGLVAATPPLEPLRMLLSAATSGNKPKVWMLSDRSRAGIHPMSGQ